MVMIKRTWRSNASHTLAGLSLALAAFTSHADANELHISTGFQSYSVDQLAEDNTQPNEPESSTVLHLAAGAKRHFGASKKHWLGFGVDRYQILGQRLLALRALDYEYQLTSQVRVGAFFGAASLNTGLPQNGYYTGFNASYLDVIPNLDIVAELRHGNGLARDRRPEIDPVGERVDMFLDFTSLGFSVRWTFGR